MWHKVIMPNDIEQHLYETIGALPLKTFCRLYDYSISKVRSKIRRGVWQENQVWLYDPDGEKHIIIEGYKAWLNPQSGGSVIQYPQGEYLRQLL